MLDDLLGRGFTSKVKSLVKATKTRIEAVRKKRNASQKFLKKDIADLLANGLDINAFGRAEGLVSELILSSCYDFVEHCCDTVLKNLSALQKRRECTEECKVAVASLMFAAARLSDLPELRDLRQTFQGRYGNSFELYINQKFVKNLSPNPATMEHKCQLLQDIAMQNSIEWNAKAFEQRMSASLVSRPKDSVNYASLCTIYHDGSKTDSSCKAVSGNGEDKVNIASMQAQVDRHHQDRKENVDSRNEAPSIKSFGNRLLTCSIKEEVVSVRRVEPVIPYFGAKNVTKTLESHNSEKLIVRSKPATSLQVDRHHQDRKENVDSRNEAPSIKSFGNRLLTCSIKEEVVSVRRVEPVIPYFGAKNVTKTLESHNSEKLIVRSKPATSLLESYNGRLLSWAPPSMDTIEPDSQTELRGTEQNDMLGSRYGKEQVMWSQQVTDFLEPQNHRKFAAADSTKPRDLSQEIEANPFSSKYEWNNGEENARPHEQSRDHIGLSRSLGTILASQNDSNSVPASGNNVEWHKSPSSRKLQAEEKARRKDFRPPPYVTIPKAKKEEGVGSQVIAKDQIIPGSGNTHDRTKGLHDHPKYEKTESDVVKPLRANGSVAISEFKNVGFHEEGVHYQMDASDQIENKFGRMPDHRWSQFDHPEHKKQVNEPGRAISHDQNEACSDHDSLSGIILPKPRSIRRRIKRSSSNDSSHNEGSGKSDEKRTVNKTSVRRRRLRDSRRGHQHTLIADDAPTKDEEEKMIDNLLIHYSSKPTSFDRHEEAINRTGKRPVSTQFHPRSISLPREHSAQLQPAKVFTRAASFQPDRPPQHVHPKLPDYDDLAARFSAMKSNF